MEGPTSPLPSKLKTSISTLEVDGSTITSSKEIANIFNKYFIGVGSSLASAIPQVDIDPMFYLNKYLRNSIIPGFKFSCVDIETVNNLFKNLPVNKATGIDGYQASLLKMCAPSLAPSLVYLFNKSLSLGTFPSSFKKGKVTPLFKSNSKLEPGNYRPITVLPILSKFLERIVHNQVYKYLDANKLISVCQSGFRANHSTVSSLIRFTDFCHDKIGQGNYIGMVELDLRKAFDTVNHDILLKKLGLYGFDDLALRWFSSYLSDRHQVVCIGDELSDPLLVTCGVPQGSILGPLLFIMYINDLVSCSSSCSVNMFADDTIFYIAHHELSTVKQQLQRDLCNISSWLCSNKLSLHIGKTHTILLGSQRKINQLSSNLTLELQGEKVNQTNSVKYLGITVDRCLNYSEHVDNIIKKLNKGLGILKRASALVPQSSLVTIYNTVMLPHIDYCSVVWGGCNDRDITRLQRLQNRAMRVILKCHYRTHINTMLTSLKWMSVRQRLHYSRCVWMWKVGHGLVPGYMESMFSSNFGYNTRSSTNGNYRVTACNHNTFQYSGIRAWNGLPHQIKALSSLPSFKKALTTHILASHS